VRPLDLIPPPGCSLSPAELADQSGRARRLASGVLDVARVGDTLHVSFGGGVDAGVLRELIVTERACCSFLTIDYDEVGRRLSVAASDEQGREVVSRFHAFFSEAAR
jgi:hypothetical protein